MCETPTSTMSRNTQRQPRQSSSLLKSLLASPGIARSKGTALRLLHVCRMSLDNLCKLVVAAARRVAACWSGNYAQLNFSTESRYFPLGDWWGCLSP